MSILLKTIVLAVVLGAFYGCGGGGGGGGERESKPRVIVVGAGMSGATAAKQLSDAGYEVQVLEARDRIGGRTWSDRSLGVALDLGASWIHGIEDNPIYALATELGVPLFEWDYDSQSIYDQTGTLAPDLFARQGSLGAGFAAAIQQVFLADDTATVQDAVDAARASGVFDAISDSEENLIVNLNFEQEYAADSSVLALKNLFAGEGFDGPEVVFPQGYDELVSALLIDSDISLDTQVTAINYLESTVTVETNRGTYEAEYVVVTVPLGVLKNNVIEFTPSLPERKQQAIDTLDMGVMNKVYLRFPSIFWDVEVDNIAYVSEAKGQFSYWLNLAGVSQQPILLAFNVATFGTEIEKFSDDEIVSKAMEVLTKIYGEHIPQPDDYVITRWAQDPYSFGSYSYLPKNATTEMRADLAAPVDDRLFFAGEATSTDYSATVHGAHLSGIAAADSVKIVIERQ